MSTTLKYKLATILTFVVAFLAVVQEGLTSSPLPGNTVQLLSSIIAFSALVLTQLKMYFSPEVSNTGTTVTLIATIVAILGGIADYIGIFGFNEATQLWIKWVISIVALGLNIFAKTIFPSTLRKETLYTLKTSTGK